MKKIAVLLLFLFCIALSCERDDICAESTPTTPRLVMDFLDLQNPDVAKSVTNFRVEVADNPDMVLPDYLGTGSTSSILIPLKTTENSTSYVFYNGYTEDSSGVPTGGNQDVVTFTYEREEIYVSRACGYKTIFKNITFEILTDSDNWIGLIESVNDNQSIEDETTTHFNLLH